MEIKVTDTAQGVNFEVGKRSIGQIKEEEGFFWAYDGRDAQLGRFKNYADAEEEIIRHYNLAL